MAKNLKEELKEFNLSPEALEELTNGRGSNEEEVQIAKSAPSKASFTNSKLVNYTKLSPNCNSPRNNSIKKITIHHMAGNLTVESCGNVFSKSSAEASANYGIDSNGRVGLYVEERNRAWTSSSPANDNQAVTIEVANDEIGGNWHVSDTAYNKLIDLCVDICQRNGIPQLVWNGTSSGTLTCHYMFTATACPGPYLKSKMASIAAAVNARLQGQPQPTPTPVPPAPTPTKGFKYQSHANGVVNWYPTVNGYNINDINNGFAGVPGKAMDAIAVNLDGVQYRVHTAQDGWLPAVTGFNPADFNNGYAGVGGHNIDGFMIMATGKSLTYRAQIIENGKTRWLPEVTGYSTADSNNGYAGKLGCPICAIAIRVN